MFGIGSDLHTPPYNPCLQCGKRDCPARRA